MKYCWFGIYWDPITFEGPFWVWKNAEDYDFETVVNLIPPVHSDDPEHNGNYYYPTFRYDYYICKIVAEDPETGEMDKSFGWIEVWFYTGYYYQNGYYEPPHAYVYDSEGNFYEVDLTIE